MSVYIKSNLTREVASKKGNKTPIKREQLEGLRIRMAIAGIVIGKRSAKNNE